MKTRTTLTLLFCLFAVVLIAQDPVPDKGSGILYFSGKPASTPVTSISSEYAFDMTTGKVYTWNRDSSDWYPYPDITHSFAAPSGDPGTDSKLHIDRTNGNLYQWDGDSWEQIVGGGASTAALADTSAAIRADALELPDTASTVSTKYYADLFNDNLAGRGTTTKQAFLDSLAGFQSFADITSIQLASPRVGYKLEDRRTGVRYKVQSDSALYYTVDDSLVIDLTGKYAVADLSGKRTFKTMSEFKREAPLCGFTGKAEKVKIGELEVWITPSPMMLFTDIENYTLEPDGLFLDTVQVAFSGENVAKSSRYFIPAGAAYGWNFQPTYKLNYSVSDQNSKEGVLLTGITGSSNNTVFLYPSSGTISTGEDYTYSFDMKVQNASGTPYIIMAGVSTDTVYLNTDGRVHRYEITFENNNATFSRLDFEGTSATDTFVFSRPQLELGTSATDYKETVLDLPAQTGKMYINFGAAIIESSALRLDRLGTPVYNDLRYFGDDTNIIRSAYAFCDEGRNCNKIITPRGIIFLTDTITPAYNVVLEGAVPLQTGQDDTPYGQRGSVIFCEVADSTKSLFTFAPQGADTKFENGGLRNLQIVVRDTLKSIIDVTEIQGGIFENLILDVDNDARVDTGILWQVNPSSDQTKNVLYNIKWKGEMDWCMKYEGSTANYMGRWDMNQMNNGLLVTGGNQCFIREYLLAQSCDVSLQMEGGDVVIQGFYTEGSGRNGGAALKMSGGVLTLYNPSLQSQSTSDSLWSISGGEKLTVYGGQIRTFGRTRTTGINAMSFYNVGSTQPLSDLPVTLGMSRRISVYDNFNWATKKTFNNNVQGDYRQRDVLASNSTFLNTVVGDTLTASELTLKGEKVNFLGESEQFDAGSFIEPGGTDTIKVFSNATLAPDGTTSAELITYQGSDIGGGSVAWCDFPMLDSFEIGDEFVFTMYVNPHQDMGQSRGLFEIRPYSDPDNEVEFNFYAPEDTWTRLPGIRGTIVDNTGGSTMSIRFRGALPDGDSLSIWGAYMKPGRYESTYIKTTTTGINDTTLTLYVNNGGKMTIDADIEVTGDIQGNFGGTTSGTTDGSGTLTITHGLSFTPEAVTITNANGQEDRNYKVTSISDTSIGVTIYDGPNPVVSEGYSLYWIASK